MNSTLQPDVFSQGSLCSIKLSLVAKGSPVRKTVETIIWPKTVTLTLKKQSKAKHFPHDTLAHNDAFPYYVWLQKVKSFRRYHPGKQSVTFWTFALTLTLTLNTAVHRFHKTLGDCDSWWCIIVPSSVTKVSAVQKVPSGQTLNWILNHFCEPLPFTQQLHIFKTCFGLWWSTNKLSCTTTVETEILWLHKPLLWPWPWR